MPLSTLVQITVSKINIWPCIPVVVFNDYHLTYSPDIMMLCKLWWGIFFLIVIKKLTSHRNPYMAVLCKYYPSLGFGTSCLHNLHKGWWLRQPGKKRYLCHVFSVPTFKPCPCPFLISKKGHFYYFLLISRLYL